MEVAGDCWRVAGRTPVVEEEEGMILSRFGMYCNAFEFGERGLLSDPSLLSRF